MSEIVPFDFHDHQVRVVMLDGEPWWVVNDVCAVLGIANPRAAVERLEVDDVGLTDVIDSVGRRQQTNVVNEPGLYELIFRSDKPEAKPFRRWVTTEVLPTIRKTGNFIAKPLSPAEQLVAHAQAWLEHERRMTSVEARVDSLEHYTGWFTALAFARREGLPGDSTYLQTLGRLAGAITRQAGQEPGKVHDQRFGWVNSYPEWALRQATEGEGE